MVKERFALLQTPAFVRSFMLDRTLGEALKVWKADEIRVVDPACGSGHFLIDALRRLVDATSAQHPEWASLQVVQSVLSRIVGIDLNDYAAALARARLVMTGLELSGEGQLAAAGKLQPNVFWADGLEQVERGEALRPRQLLLGENPETVAKSTLTPEATREALRPVLHGGFHVVVANPPYITESDEARKKYHKEKVGNPTRARYLSAHRSYGLGAPFTERCFQLSVKSGFVGLISSNAFAKREYGVPLVEDVLANQDLTLLVDTSGAFIPGHGTPTLLLFGRHRPPTREQFAAVLGKRGEPGTPSEPAVGRVWSAILSGWDTPEFDSPFVSTEAVARLVFSKHPWSLRGGGALDLQLVLESRSPERASSAIQEIGRTNVCGEDPVFIREAGERMPSAIDREFQRALVVGEVVRDFGICNAPSAIYPYCSNGGESVPADHPMVAAVFWRHRATLRARTVFGKSSEERGEAWFSHLEHYRERLKLNGCLRAPTRRASRSSGGIAGRSGRHSAAW